MTDGAGDRSGMVSAWYRHGIGIPDLRYFGTSAGRVFSGK
jgi:hypothetical protein